MWNFAAHSGPAAEPLPTDPGAAFAVQFKASYRVLWLIAMGIVRNAAQAEDVVQEAALTALGKLDQFEPGSNFVAWMGQTVRFVAMNQYRKERKRRAAPLEETFVDAADTFNAADGGLRLTAGGQLDKHQTQFDDRVAQALEKLGETARVCLLLRTVENWEYAEIAQALNIPEGTAMSHVHRARQFLRERLSGTATETEKDTRADTNV